MLQYILKRLGYSILTVFLISTITFFLMNLIPGGPFLSEKNPPEAALKAMNEKYGLDQPKIVQYKNYMIRLAHGDLGVSIKKKGRSINDIIAEKFPVSARIGGLAIIFAILVGVPLGALAALNRGKWWDSAIMFVATLGISIPSFVLATTLMIFFGVTLKLLPTYGLNSPVHYILPVFSLAFYPMAYISRLMRTSMLDVLNQDYIRTAKAKGVAPFFILFKHALRNAILPVITYLGPSIVFILTGSLIVETIFTIPGLGGEFVGSITSRDYPLIMGTTIFLATLMVFMNVIVDILYKIIDPRVNLK